MLSDRLGDGVTADHERDPRAIELRDSLRTAVATPRRKARANGDPSAG